ncbi:MAG: class I SAM-dependent methyltransferase [Dehalococcoidales bacterium]|jgi:hypothetical protein
MLDHHEYEKKPISNVAGELKSLARELDQKHRLQRKIQFLLDIRGYFIVNQIQGCYIEFGVYRGEMTFCATDILDKTKCLSHYIGLDTFEGEPKLSESERAANPFIKENDYSADYDETIQFLKKAVGDRVSLIKGDFRNDEVLSKIEPYIPIALCVIDCNLLSSIKKSIEYSLPRMKPSGVIFVDDLFVNMHTGRCEVLNILEKEAKKNNLKLIEYNTYAPCAKAFIVVKDENGRK